MLVFVCMFVCVSACAYLTLTIKIDLHHCTTKMHYTNTYTPSHMLAKLIHQD